MIHAWRLALGFFALMVAAIVLAVVVDVAQEVGWWLLLGVPAVAVCYLAGTLTERLMDAAR